MFFGSLSDHRRCAVSGQGQLFLKTRHRSPARASSPDSNTAPGHDSFTLQNCFYRQSACHSTWRSAIDATHMFAGAPLIALPVALGLGTNVLTSFVISDVWEQTELFATS